MLELHGGKIVKDGLKLTPARDIARKCMSIGLTHGHVLDDSWARQTRHRRTGKAVGRS